MGQSNPKFVSYAAQDGRVQDLVYHLGISGPNGLKPASGSEKNRTPLHLAAMGGFLECISVLYDAGERVCALCSMHILPALLCVGADLNVQDADGMTALHHATARGHLYAAQLLLDLGAKETITTRYTAIPIIWLWFM